MVAAKKNDSSVPPRMPPQRKAYGKARIPVPTALFVSVKTELKKVPLGGGDSPFVTSVLPMFQVMF